MQTVTVTPGKVHQTKYGALPHSDMIGRQFGTKVCYTLSLTNVASFLALEKWNRTEHGCSTVKLSQK